MAVPKFLDAQRPLLTGRNFWDRGAHCEWDYLPKSTHQGLVKWKVQLKTVWKKPRLSVLHILKLTEGHTLKPSQSLASRIRMWRPRERFLFSILSLAALKWPGAPSLWNHLPPGPQQKRYVVLHLHLVVKAMKCNATVPAAPVTLLTV